MKIEKLNKDNIKEFIRDIDIAEDIELNDQLYKDFENGRAGTNGCGKYRREDNFQPDYDAQVAVD